MSDADTINAESASPRSAVAEVVSSLWWLVLLRGIVLIILGAYALRDPGMTLVAFTQVLAIFVIVDGVLAIVAGIMGWVESRGWTFARGVLGVLVGGFVFAHPVVMGAIAATVVVYLIAFQAIICGILEIATAIRERKEIEGEGWLILGGALSIIFGLLLSAAPLLSSMALIRVVGIFAIVFGIVMIVSAFRVRSFGKRLATAN